DSGCSPRVSSAHVPDSLRERDFIELCRGSVGRGGRETRPRGRGSILPELPSVAEAGTSGQGNLGERCASPHGALGGSGQAQARLAARRPATRRGRHFSARATPFRKGVAGAPRLLCVCCSAGTSCAHKQTSRSNWLAALPRSNFT